MEMDIVMGMETIFFSMKIIPHFLIFGDDDVEGRVFATL
jgi:hypothetical protein